MNPEIKKKEWLANFENKNTWRPITLLKRDSTQVLSCEIYVNFKNSFFYRTPPVVASVPNTHKQAFFPYKYFLSRI